MACESNSHNSHERHSQLRMKHSEFSDDGAKRRGVIYVDESGTPGTKAISHNHRHPYFILGFCYCKNYRRMTKKLHKLLQNLQRDDVYPTELKEIKFNPTSSLAKVGYSPEQIRDKWEPHYATIRAHTAKIIADNADGVFAGIVNKKEISNPVNSEELGNFVFMESLYKHVLPAIESAVTLSVIYDRGRLNPSRAKKFNENSLISHPNRTTNSNFYANISKFEDVDSLRSAGIWAGDFVAGAFHWKIKHKDSVFADLLSPRFIGNGSIMVKCRCKASCLWINPMPDGATLGLTCLLYLRQRNIKRLQIKQ